MTETSSTKRRAPAIVLAFALLVAGLGALASVVWLTMPRGGETASTAVGGAFSLTDQTGRRVDQATIAGRPSLVFFGFTHCPDICPTKLFEITQMLDRMGAEAEKVNVLFITVDPERDTRELLATYLGSFHPRILGLTGTPEEVTRAMQAYRAYARKVPLEGGGYTMDHTAFVYLMDKRGAFVKTFDLQREPEAAAAELKRYI